MGGEVWEWGVRSGSVGYEVRHPRDVGYVWVKGVVEWYACVFERVGDMR